MSDLRGQVEPASAVRPPVRPVARMLTPEQAAHLLRLVESGQNDPDLWTRDERAAVTALFAVRDGRA